jgi:hypothetical protein
MKKNKIGKGVGNAGRRICKPQVGWFRKASQRQRGHLSSDER